MRFAYIDSHGNEVPIPSVDALALRIELGAVGPDTQLYDAQADHWAPARTHEIFHSLSRGLGSESFIVPPPPVATPAAQPPPQAPTPAAPTKPHDEPSGKDEFDLGLTLAEPSPARAAGAEPEVASPGDGEGPDWSGAAAAEPPDAADPEVDFGGAFDLADLGPVTPGGPAEDLELETPLQFTGALSFGVDPLELEPPMSEFRPDHPPVWAKEQELDEDEVMEFSPVPAAPVEEEEDPLPTAAEPMRRRPAPRIRPSSPRFRRQRSLSGPIVLITLLLAVAVGGYVGWPILSARFGLQRTAERPSVLLPMIPDDLVPQMRELAETAIADAIDEVDASAVPTGAPREPAAEWLAGVYLANASQFGSVEEFWSSIGSLAEDLRAADWSLYHEKMLDRVASEGLSQETAAIIVERADSGYAAAAGRRAQTYAALDRLVEAALDLHDFLVRSEASIEYRPASASTVDPVLEAVPSTPELGDRMWDMVDDITEALDALGSLDRVTRERLITAVKERLQNVGIQ